MTALPVPRRSRWLRSLLLGLALLLVAVNALALVHVRAALHFVPSENAAPTPAVTDIRQLPLADQLRWALGGVPIPRPANRATPAAHFLPYDVHTIALPNDETLEAWYIPHPQGRGLVLMFPGYAAAKEALLTPAAVLFEWGYSSLLVDFRGAGGSSRSDTTLGMREAADVAASLRYAQERWAGQPLVLYGLSMGSSAILRAVALEGARPDALILEGSFDRLQTTVGHRFTALGLPAFPADLLLFWGSMASGYDAFAHNPVDYAASVDAPTLLLSGASDPWILPQEVQAVANQLRGPRRLVLLEGVGHHMPFVFPAGEAWKQELRAFLDQLPPPAAP